MADPQTQAEQTTSKQRLRWRLAMAFTSFVTIAGLIVAVHQFALKYVWDEHGHTRTLPGLLFISIGISGIYLPFRLIRQRHQFTGFSAAGQWFNAMGIPLLYLIGYVALVIAALRSDTLILPRPFAPTAVVTYERSQEPGNRTSIRFRNAIRDQLPGGRGLSRINDSEDAVERFKASFEQVFLGRENTVACTLAGESRVLPDQRVEISIHVDTRDRLQFSVFGLDGVAITRDGKSIREYDAKSGKYKIVIVGRPRQGI